jgi:hypothetical protein
VADRFPLVVTTPNRRIELNSPSLKSCNVYGYPNAADHFHCPENSAVHHARKASRLRFCWNPETPAYCWTREPASSQCLLLLIQAGVLRVGVDNATGNDRKYGADVLDRVVRHGEVVVAQHDKIGVIANF